jgi:hypothetical protein
MINAGRHLYDWTPGNKNEEVRIPRMEQSNAAV